MKWEHKCKLEWLKARSNFLTATDVKSLIPFTKTGKKRTVTDVDRMRVLAGKCVTLTEDDCWSYGAAARGHLLEPYAISLLDSAMGWADDEKLHHWDDMIIAKNIGTHCLAFSPDAMDLLPESSVLVKGATVQYISAGLPIVHKIGEVKSYAAEKHFVCGCTDKMELEERWQIATAMAVLPSIETAYLVFYNPSVPGFEMFVHEYTRNDLEDEIAIVLEVEKEWKNFLENTKAGMLKAACFYGGPDELAIHDMIGERQALEPGM